MYQIDKSNMYKFKNVFDPLLHVTSAVIGFGVLHYNFTIKNSELIVKSQAVLFYAYFFRENF